MKLLEIIGQWFQNITYTFNVIKELCCEPCVISWRLNFWPHNSAFRCKWKYYIPYCKSICSLWNCVELPSALKGCWGKHYKVWILWEAVEHSPCSGSAEQMPSPRLQRAHMIKMSWPTSPAWRCLWSQCPKPAGQCSPGPYSRYHSADTGQCWRERGTGGGTCTTLPG